MGRPATTNTEKLLKRIKKTGGMTRKEMVKFLLQLNGNGAKSYGEFDTDRGLYSALFYGTSRRTGILENFCEKNDDGTYSVVRKIQAPFTTKRESATY